MVEKTADLPDSPPLCGVRLVKVLLLEMVMVSLMCLAIAGFAWEAGYLWLGLITAGVIWVCVSPIVEIATWRGARRR